MVGVNALRRHGLSEAERPRDTGPGLTYVLAVKKNQGRLYEDVRDLFEGAGESGLDGVPHGYATTLKKGHGHIERRECWSISDDSCY